MAVVAGVRFLVGTSAYNAHVQNIVQALDESESLYAYITGGVDHFRSPLSRRFRNAIARGVPSVDRQLRRRRIFAAPPGLVYARWRWELPTLVAGRLGLVRLEDWCWERGEFSLDRHCARLLRDSRATGFLGVEHGALRSIETARALGKPSVVTFLSPHHRTRARWVTPEYDRFPELWTRARKAVDRRSHVRDARRDEEARAADWILTGSSFTTRSLVDAGYDARKILTVPLGGPTPIAEDDLPARPATTFRFVFAGMVSVHKGAHYLLRAWARVARPGAELHLYGRCSLPASLLREAQAGPGGASIVLHGSIPPSDLPAVYQQAGALVLPTLCDGFGQVVSDALANGLPVIATRNAGAADVIQHGRSGFVIEPASEDALAIALTWCLDHPREMLEMRRAARAAAAGWTWTDFRRQIREGLGDALDPASAGVRTAQALGTEHRAR